MSTKRRSVPSFLSLLKRKRKEGKKRKKEKGVPVRALDRFFL